MSSRPLRFIQAGGFQLHQPMHGLAEVPDHLMQSLVEAPYLAAERVFDAAVAEGVDFVLLAGDLCNPHCAGARGLVFLARQFARLADHGIAVYWAAAPTDGRLDWPAHLVWPAGVHVFAANRVEHLTHHRDGKPVCQIAGFSVDERPTAAQATITAHSATPSSPMASFPVTSLAPSAAGLFSIAIVPGPLPFDPDEMPAIGHYLARGGLPRAATVVAESPPGVAHCTGMPQGRGPRDIGPFGCTLVHVEDIEKLDSQDQIRLTPIPTDVVRWQEETVLWPPLNETPDLERLLHERMRSLIAAADGRTLLVRWRIAGSHAEIGNINASNINASNLAAELVSMLRTEYGFSETPAWTVSLSVVPADLPESWRQQQTLLGEFLRRTGELESANVGGTELDCFLDSFLPEPQLAGALADRINLVDSTVRANVLRQAAILGAELLSSGAGSRESPHGGSSWTKGAGSR
jgi:hypothetical protein